MTNRVIIILSLWLAAFIIVGAFALTIFLLRLAVDWWES